MKFTIYGNQEKQDGNPIPYERTTQRAKWTARYKRYTAWKNYVVWSAKIMSCGFWDARLFDGAEKTRLDCMIYFGNMNHADPENIRKGIQDALFENDKLVWGLVDFGYDHCKPRVEVEVTRDETGKP